MTESSQRNKVYLSIACDADPDINLPFFKAPSRGRLDEIWSGVVHGVYALRKALSVGKFVAAYGQPQITWLLRCDRQIAEVYGDPCFCYRRFQHVWDEEVKLGSEIGWHPHLFRWSARERRWRPYLGQDEDLQMLTECLQVLRDRVSIRSVRTGWDYHSNTLMKFLCDQRLLVDASAIPGSLQFGDWRHDWRHTPRSPYFPSSVDYRRPVRDGESALDVVELPTLVRLLPFRLHFSRFLIRGVRALRRVGPFDWESARWQGARITHEQGLFSDAVRQTLGEASDGSSAFLSTYFHTGDLVYPVLVGRVSRNLESLRGIAAEFGFELVPTTLSEAARRAKQSGLAAAGTSLHVRA